MFNVIDGLDSGNGRQVSVIHHLVLHFSLEMRMALMEGGGGGEQKDSKKSKLPLVINRAGTFQCGHSGGETSRDF